MKLYWEKNEYQPENDTAIPPSDYIAIWYGWEYAPELETEHRSPGVFAMIGQKPDGSYQGWVNENTGRWRGFSLPSKKRRSSWKWI